MRLGSLQAVVLPGNGERQTQMHQSAYKMQKSLANRYVRSITVLWQSLMNGLTLLVHRYLGQRWPHYHQK